MDVMPLSDSPLDTPTAHWIDDKEGPSHMTKYKTRNSHGRSDSGRSASPISGSEPTPMSLWAKVRAYGKKVEGEYASAESLEAEEQNEETASDTNSPKVSMNSARSSTTKVPTPCIEDSSMDARECETVISNGSDLEAGGEFSSDIVSDLVGSETPVYKMPSKLVNGGAANASESYQTRSPKADSEYETAPIEPKLLVNEEEKNEPKECFYTDACKAAAKDRLLQKSKLTPAGLTQLIGIMSKLKAISHSADNLVDRFAKKCYKRVGGDVEAQREQADRFVEAAFGNKENLWKYGAERAFEMEVEAVMRRGEGNSVWTHNFGKYLVGEKLGRGGQADVYRGRDTETGRMVAFKVYKPKYGKEDAMKECTIMQSIKEHQNVIKIHDAFPNCMWSGVKTTVLALEFASKGELIEYLMHTGRFEAELSRWVFRGLLKAVIHCHTQETPIAHRDLKHDNCLFGVDPVTGKWAVKITDFGLSKALPAGQVMKTMTGTEMYAATELLYGYPYDERVDIFSMGVMLFMMLSGSQPFKRADEHDTWFKYVIHKDWPSFWYKFSKRRGAYDFTDEEKELLQGMLDPNPNTRFTLKQVSGHRWTKGRTYSDEKVADVLEKRHLRVMVKKHEKATQKTKLAAKKRGDAQKYPAAPVYHTNIPEPGLWFYSHLPANDILETVNAVIVGDPFCGKTNFEKSFEKPKSERIDDETVGASCFKLKLGGCGASGETDKSLIQAKAGEILKTAVACATAPTEGPKMTPIRPQAKDISGMSAQDARKEGIYQLEFRTKPGKGQRYNHGTVQIYACPDDRYMHIVKFKAADHDATSLFPRIFGMLMKGGGNDGLATIMAHPENVITRFLEMEKLIQVPSLEVSAL